MKLVSAILGLSLAACVTGSDGGGSDSNILGGSVDDADVAVGALRIFKPDGGLSLCTATLVSPRVMLTAGHCAELGAQYDVSFATTPQLSAPIGSSGFTRAQVIANPEFDGNNLEGGHDISVVLLARPVSTSPVQVGPTPAIGEPLKAVGYGQNDFGAGTGVGAGTRRTVNTTVLATDDHLIESGIDGASTCFGDSGGPHFDSSGRIVATTSFGSLDCHGSGFDTRIDDNLDFLAAFLPVAPPTGGGGGGSTNVCRTSVNGKEVACTNGECTCSVNGQQVSTCTAPDPSSACSIPGNCCGF